VTRGPTIVVAGALANRPGNGGGAWVRLSFVRGLDRLGCGTFFVEQISEDACVDADGEPAPFERSVNRSWFHTVTAEHGLAGRAALIVGETGEVDGMRSEELDAIARDADLLVNLSGNLTDDRLLRRFRTKAFVDLDPGFTQFWHAAGEGGTAVDGHDVWFTVGENIGSDGCTIPDCRITWRTIRQPVVLDDWPVVAGDNDLATTIASWRGPFGPVERDGRRYGLKAHEFRRFVDLPASAPLRFELALEIDPADDADRDLLTDNGWSVVDPEAVASDPQAFRDYVQRSGAEFSVAKEMYVRTNSGWFSDRSVRYLASGKPVLVQDTGFSRNIPSDEGVVAFTTLDEAAAGAASIKQRYDEHAAAARHIAERWFDSDVVLDRMLSDVGMAP
jgi:hypothetical protein